MLIHVDDAAAALAAAALPAATALAAASLPAAAFNRVPFLTVAIAAELDCPAALAAASLAAVAALGATVLPPQPGQLPTDAALPGSRGSPPRRAAQKLGKGLSTPSL